LFDVAEIAQFSKVDRAEYEESLKVFWDFSNVLSSAERKGREEGIAEGKREEKLRNAKSFKDLGVDVEKISQATGLTKEEIERL
jgi:predicted transposase/invertase (TIGR01784 family)